MDKQFACFAVFQSVCTLAQKGNTHTHRHAHRHTHLLNVQHRLEPCCRKRLLVGHNFLRCEHLGLRKCVTNTSVIQFNGCSFPCPGLWKGIGIGIGLGERISRVMSGGVTTNVSHCSTRWQMLQRMNEWVLDTRHTPVVQSRLELHALQFGRRHAGSSPLQPPSRVFWSKPPASPVVMQGKYAPF